MKKNKKSESQEQQDFNNNADEWFGNIFITVIFCLFLYLFFSGVKDFFGWAGDKMDSRDSRKERCINETYNIKNEFTAKKMYQACMKR